MGNEFIGQNEPGIFGTAESSDWFGWSLAAANFGKSAEADLAIGVPQEDLAAFDDGGVHIVYGSSGGLTATGNQFWTQNSSGIVETAEEGDGFGVSVVVL